MLEDSPPPRPSNPPTKSKGWQPPTTAELQTHLPQYEITALLGRGGMGAVYKGTQINLDRPVAIKILPPGMDDEDTGANFTERFKNEARAMAKLSHPGIVAVYDSGETADGLLYIVMEFIEGTDVQKMVSQQGRLHSEHAMAITAHVCDALQYAHERGIIHRDIKPANIMVGYDGVVKVADFGLAKMERAGESGLTRSGMAMGTLHYMAPEALMLGSSVDHRADIYAVGVMLYFMLTGRLPQGMFELPSMQVPGLDPRFDSIIAKALRDDRDIRYQTTAELRRDLDGILTQPVVKVSADDTKAPAALETQARPQRPAGLPQHPAQPSVITRNNKRGLSLLWVVVVLIGGLLIWLGFGKRAPDSVEETDLAPEVSTPTTQKDPTAVANSSSSILPKPPMGVWRDLLGDDPKQEFIFRLGAPADFVSVAEAGGSARGYRASGSVTLLSKAIFKDFAFRIRFIPPPGNGYLPWLIARGMGDGAGVTCFPSSTSVRWSAQFYDNGKFQSQTLASKTLTINTQAQTPTELEVRVKEDQFVLSQDGRTLIEGRDSRYLDGRIGFRAAAGTIIEKLEVMSLDSAPALAAAVKDPPPPTSLTTVTSVAPQQAHQPVTQDVAVGVWHDMFEEKLISATGFEKLAPGDPRGAGYLETTTSTIRASEPVFQDCILRARFSGEWETEPGLFVRRIGRNPYNYIAARFSGYQAGLYRHISSTKAPPIATSTNMATPLVRNKSFEMELRVVGNAYTLLRDGKVVIEGTDSSYATGHVGFNVKKGTIIEKLEVMPLESTTASPVAAVVTPIRASGEWRPLLEDKPELVQKLQITDSTTPGWKVMPKGFFPVLDEKNVALRLKARSYKQLRVVTFWSETPQNGIFGYNLRIGPSSTGKICLFNGCINQTSTIDGVLQPNSYQSTKRNPPFEVPDGQEFELEVRTIEDRLNVLVDGKEKLEVSTELPGQVTALHPFGPLEFKELSWRRLIPSSLSPAKAAPAPSPPPLVIPAIAGTVTNTPGTIHSWTDRQGRQIQAVFVRLQQDSVILKLPNRQEPHIPLGSLSDKSQELARQLAAAMPPPSTTSTSTAEPSPSPQVIVPAVFTNTLGMKFVPVPGTKVLFCIHETRHGDFAAFAEAASTSGSWKNQAYGGVEISTRKDEHPVTNVTGKQATQFCAWLSQKESRKYRLPTQEEWSLAASAGGKAEFPWGDAWPPPVGAGNYSDETYHKLRPTDPYLSGFDDGFPTTAPVMSFKPNTLGIFDLGGNVAEMTHAGDPAAAAFEDYPPMVQRGASFLHDVKKTLRSANESPSGSSMWPDKGFRVVVEIQ